MSSDFTFPFHFLSNFTFPFHFLSNFTFPIHFLCFPILLFLSIFYVFRFCFRRITPLHIFFNNYFYFLMLLFIFLDLSIKSNNFYFVWEFSLNISFLRFYSYVYYFK